MTRHETPLTGLRVKADGGDSLRDIDRLLRYTVKSKNADERIRMAEADRASPRVIAALQKAAQPGADTSTLGATTIGAEFGLLYSQARNLGAADLMAQYAMRMPRARGRFNIMSSVTASTVAEGAGKPVRRLNLSTSDVTPAKGTAQIVLTREVLDGLDAANAMASIRRELMRSVTQWTDSAMLASLTGNSGEAQSVDTVSDFLATDFEELLLLVGASAGSQLFMITTPSISKSLAAHLLTLGVNVSWPRFEIAGVTVVASDAQTSQRVTMVSADAIAMWLSPVEVRSSEVADLEMSDTPAQTSGTSVQQSQMVSLFTTNSIALLTERSAAIKPLVPNAHAHLTSVAFGAIDSPSS